MKFNARIFIATAVAALLLAFAFPAHAGDQTAALEDSRVVEVLAMVEGGLSFEIIWAKVHDIGSFPELSGTDLVYLKDHGVPDKVLIRMIEFEQASVPAPDVTVPPVVVPPVAAPVPEVPGDTGAIQVVIERPFMITYYEVAVDGEMLAHRGKLWEGMGEPGHILQRPSKVGKRKDTVITALDTDLTPGLHEVAVGFAVTWVEDDADNNEYGKYNQEFYVNRGVRAVAADDDHEGEWGTKTAIACDVQAGKTCVVTATLEKRAPTGLGGLPIYSVQYATEVE